MRIARAIGSATSFSAFLLVMADDRAVRARPDEQEPERLLAFAGDQRNADREELVAGVADLFVAILPLRRLFLPFLDLLLRDPARAEHALVDDRGDMRGADALDDPGEDVLDQLGEVGGLTQVANGVGKLVAEDRRGSSGSGFPTSV